MKKGKLPYKKPEMKRVDIELEKAIPVMCATGACGDIMWCEANNSAF